jgi:hypothetical protein
MLKSNVMSKSIKFYKSIEDQKQDEIKYISELSYYDRLKNAMVLIRKVYAKQILENKKTRRITIISSK